MPLTNFEMSVGVSPDGKSVVAFIKYKGRVFGMMEGSLNYDLKTVGIHNTVADIRGEAKEFYRLTGRSPRQDLFYHLLGASVEKGMDALGQSEQILLLKEHLKEMLRGECYQVWGKY